MKILHITGMTCGHCKMKVEASLLELNEVESADVDLIDGTAEVAFSTDVSEEKLREKLNKSGYTLTLVENE